jgi:hypothetical protein
MDKLLLKIVNGIPHHKYDKNSDYLFHPMRAGRWLFNNATKENYENFLKIATPKENDSLVWYYPDGYKLARMLNREVTSCISQAEFLAAFCKMYQMKILPLSVLEKIFRSFEIPELIYKDALIELPLPKNHPEIILNGWLHAISRIIDYYKITNEKSDLLERTLFRLSEMLPIFDDPKRKISNYSDLTIYKTKVYNASNTKIKYTKDFIFDLTYDNKHSLYDCSFERDMGKYHFANIGVTYGVNHRLINDLPFKLEMFEGKYYPTTTLPQMEGEKIIVESTPFGSKHSLIIPTENLFKGYPTPFSKNGGANYYHTYHVVALRDIAKSYPTEHSKLFNEYADLWESYIDDRNFTTVSKMEKDYVKGKLLTD